MYLCKHSAESTDIKNTYLKAIYNAYKYKQYNENKILEIKIKLR